MTSSNGNNSRVTDRLCGEFTGHLWIPRTKASDALLCSFFDLRLNKWLSKQSWGWWFETPSRSLWHHRNATLKEPYLILGHQNIKIAITYVQFIRNLPAVRLTALLAKIYPWFKTHGFDMIFQRKHQDYVFNKTWKVMCKSACFNIFEQLVLDDYVRTYLCRVFVFWHYSLWNGCCRLCSVIVGFYSTQESSSPHSYSPNMNYCSFLPSTFVIFIISHRMICAMHSIYNCELT